MQLNSTIIFWTLVIGIPILFFVFVYAYRTEKSPCTQIKYLNETGAPSLLLSVWRLNDTYQPDELPLVGEPANVTQEKILKHMWGTSQRSKQFDRKVCDERIWLVLEYPNKLNGFVQDQATLDAIEEAHKIMADPDQRLYVGTIPLILNIHVTGREE